MVEKQSKAVGIDICLEMDRKCACANLRRAARAVTQLYDRSLKPSGLRSTQFALLTAVRVLGPVAVTTLARRAQIDRTTLGRNLKLLENRGLIKIKQGDDQRIREVSLTESGDKAISEAMPYWREAQVRIESGLGAQDFENLLRDFSAVISLVNKV